MSVGAWPVLQDYFFEMITADTIVGRVVCEDACLVESGDKREEIKAS
jgi:hypothetical protein